MSNVIKGPWIASVRLPAPPPGQVWHRVWGDLPDDWDYTEDIDGWKYFTAPPFEEVSVNDM